MAVVLQHISARSSEQILSMPLPLVNSAVTSLDVLRPEEGSFFVALGRVRRTGIQLGEKSTVFFLILLQTNWISLDRTLNLSGPMSLKPSKESEIDDLRKPFTHHYSGIL